MSFVLFLDFRTLAWIVFIFVFSPWNNLLSPLSQLHLPSVVCLEHHLLYEASSGPTATWEHRFLSFQTHCSLIPVSMEILTDLTASLLPVPPALLGASSETRGCTGLSVCPLAFPPQLAGTCGQELCVIFLSCLSLPKLWGAPSSLEISL